MVARHRCRRVVPDFWYWYTVTVTVATDHSNASSPTGRTGSSSTSNNMQRFFSRLSLPRPPRHPTTFKVVRRLWARQRDVQDAFCHVEATSGHSCPPPVLGARACGQGVAASERGCISRGGAPDSKARRGSRNRVSPQAISWKFCSCVKSI